MPASNRRSAARLAVTIVLALLVGGCGGQSNESTSASVTTATTSAPTTLAPTTAAPPPLTAKERTWLKAVPRVSRKIEKAVGASNITVTPETMHSYANTLRSCRRELLEAGSTSDRLQPAYALVKKACAQHDKGARCFDTAATLNPLGPGTHAAQAQDRAIQCGLDTATKGLSLLAEHWLPAMHARGLRPSTLARYESHVRCAIGPSLGGLPLQAVMPTHLNSLYGDLRAAGRAPKTIRNVHGVLSKALADAERWGLVSRNAARLADVPAVARPKLRVWSPEQTRAFLRAVASDRLFAAWLLAATTGMRRGELLGLRWTDVDLDVGVLRVAQVRVRAGNQVIVGEPKTARGRRTIALDPATVATLRQHHKRQAEERLLAGPPLCRQRPGVHHAGRLTDPPKPIRLVVSKAHPHRRAAGHSAARHAPLLRDGRARRHSSEGDERAPRARHRGVHARHLHQRAAGDGQVRG
jgi:integrase